MAHSVVLAGALFRGNNKERDWDDIRVEALGLLSMGILGLGLPLFLAITALHAAWSSVRSVSRLIEPGWGH